MMTDSEQERQFRRQLIEEISDHQELLEEDGERVDFAGALRSYHGQLQEDEREEPGSQTAAIAEITRLAAERGISLP